MNRLFSPGRMIALFLGLALVFFSWGLVFAPGGSGSNIVLGLVLAVVAVYYIVTNLGPYLDRLFFHGGSRTRAFALHNAKQSFLEGQARLSAVTSSKRKRARYSEDAIQKCTTALKQLEETILNVQNNWTRKDQVNEQIASLHSALANVDSAMKNLFGKKNQRHFLSGWDSLLVALVAALALRAFIVEPFQIPSGSMIPTLLVGDHLFVSKLRYGIMNPFAKKPTYLVRWGAPQAGEVVVFEAPTYVGINGGETWIKRVIAGPGQTVYIRDTVVYVDDKPYSHVTPDEIVNYLDYFGIGSHSRIFGDSSGVWREQSAIHTREKISENVTHDIYQRLSDIRLPFENEWPLLMQRKLPGLTCSASSCIVDQGHILVMGDNRGNSSDGRVWGALPIENVKGKAIFVWMSVDGSRRLVELGRFTLPGFRWERWFSAIN